MTELTEEQRLFLALSADIRGRKVIGRQWEQIDADVMLDEIMPAWEQIIATAMRAAITSAKSEQMERDCKAVCVRCDGKPDLPNEWVRPAIVYGDTWRHEWGVSGSNAVQSDLRCYAAEIRAAWDERAETENTE